MTKPKIPPTNTPHIKEKALSTALKLSKQASTSSETRLILVSGDLIVKEWFKTKNPSSLYRLCWVFHGDNPPTFLKKCPKSSILCTHAELCRIAQIPKRQNAPLSMILEADPLPSFPFDARPSQKTLVLDGIADPGNVGTLLRSAESFGFTTVIALGGTCDLQSQKVFSAARGSHFRLQLFRGERTSFEQLLQKHSSLDTPPISIAASCSGEKGLLERLLEELSANKEHSLFLVLGHESRGVTAGIEKHSLSVKIPIAPSVDSLNVAIAGSILMQHLAPKNL